MVIFLLKSFLRGRRNLLSGSWSGLPFPPPSWGIDHQTEHPVPPSVSVPFPPPPPLRHQEDFRTFLKPSMRGITRPVSRPEPAKPLPEVKVDAELAVKWDYLRGILASLLLLAVWNSRVGSHWGPVRETPEFFWHVI